MILLIKIRREVAEAGFEENIMRSVLKVEFKGPVEPHKKG